MQKGAKAARLLALGVFALAAAGRIACAQSVPDGASPWQQLALNINFCSELLLLTDGSVFTYGNRFVPDSDGNYVNLRLASVAPLPQGYFPGAFASAVLPDGRVIYEGGECNPCTEPNNFTNEGAIYDPVENAWKRVQPPPGWSTIGGAPGVVLADGIFMMGRSDESGTSEQALLDPRSLTWTVTGDGKADANFEEGWTLLPDGSVLTVDINRLTDPTSAERYDPATGTWTNAGTTVVRLANEREMGPQVLRPDGTVIVFGALTAGGDHTAIYDSSSHRWSAGPDLPTIDGQTYTMVDAPAALLPSGNVLFGASPSPSHGIPPTHYFEFDGSSFQRVADPPNAALIASTSTGMLVLPTGQVLVGLCDSLTGAGRSLIYTPQGRPDPGWAPVITAVPRTLVRGATYRVAGRKFNGFSQGAMYGDNSQMATNYPLVRIVNDATGHVFYARTFGHSSMRVNVAGLPRYPRDHTSFTVPDAIDAGPSRFFVVANGIASKPVRVTVE